MVVLEAESLGMAVAAAVADRLSVLAEDGLLLLARARTTRLNLGVPAHSWQFAGYLVRE